MGIFDPDCIKLANLHSDAVDYPKSGQPVELSRIPKLKHRIRPDWNAPETVNASSANYYPSMKAIGQLFRAIDLPVEQDRHNERPRRRGRRNANDEDELANAFRNLNFGDDYLVEALQDHIYGYIRNTTANQEDNDVVADLFERYISELRAICMANTLSHARGQLTEEEAVVGTIIQKSSQPRKRKDAMAKLRESTDILVRAIRENLVGDETLTYRDHLRRAWLAYNSALNRKTEFGAQSFSWVALGAIFEAIRGIEEELKEMGY